MSILLIKKLLKRGSKYGLVGFVTFLLDLAMLTALTSFTSISSSLAIAIAFLIAVSINFTISYHWVYAGTERSFHGGYIFFISLAFVGAIIISLSTSWLVVQFALPLLFARVVVGCIVGIINFLINTFFNFKLL